MSFTRSAAALAVCLCLASAGSIDADVKSDQKTLVRFEGVLGRVVNLFGGRAAREGVKSTTVVVGDRKASMSDTTGQIVDLSEEKIYDLDLRRKTYKVTTFDELRRQMEEAQRKAQEAAQRERAKETPSEQAKASPDQPQLEIDFDVKETGEKKTVNGFSTRQVVMTIALREKGKTLEEAGGMVLTTDMWLTPRVAALDEIAAFDLRYAKQLAGPMLTGASMQEMASALAMYPGLQDGLARMRAESGKMDGTPIMTTLTVDAVKSAEMMAAEKKEGAESPAASGTVGGLIGGFARRAARKEPEAPRARATFMTSTDEVLGVSTSVAPADVAIPAAFKENK